MHPDGGVGYVESADEGKPGFAGACIMMLFGCLLFPGSLGLLAWNEQQTVCDNNKILMAEDEAVVVDCGATADAEGKFAFYSCPIEDEGMEKMSPLTSFNTPGLQDLVNFKSIAGSQKIEMYQCIETKEKEEVKSGSTSTALLDVDEAEEASHENEEQQSSSRSKGRRSQQGQRSLSVRDEVVRSERRRRSNSGTEEAYVYRYKMAWTDVYYNSHEFKGTPQNIASAGCPDFVYQGQVNHNPPVPDRGDGTPAELGRQLIHTTAIIAGGFTFNDEAELKKLEAQEQVSMEPFKDHFTLQTSTDNIITALSPSTLGVHAGQTNYLGSCQSDRLGCVRISFNQSEASHVSVIGKVGGSGVMEAQPVESTWGCGSSSFTRMYPREMSKEDMIAQLKSERSAKTWILRVVGLVCAWLSLYCMFQPISASADAMGDCLNLIPLCGGAVGSLFEGVVEMFLCIIACGWGCSCGLLVIAIIWLGMRPMIGGPLLAGVLLLFAIGFIATKKAERDPRKMRAKQQGYGQQAPLMEQQAYDQGYEEAPGGY